MILIERPMNGGTQTVHKFDNGYGASVIAGGTYTYGADQGLKELAVIKFYEGDKYKLCYSTEITDDVLGYLSDEDVADLLVKIEALEANKQ